MRQYLVWISMRAVKTYSKAKRVGIRKNSTGHKAIKGQLSWAMSGLKNVKCKSDCPATFFSGGPDAGRSLTALGGGGF
jgi:hypothetical protein